MRKKEIFILIYLINLIINLAADNSRTLGRDDYWQGTNRDGIDLVPGKQGFYNLVLAQNEYRPDPFSDLLISFNDENSGDLSANYRIEKSLEINQLNSHRGKGAGVFRGNGGFKLYPESEKALFSGKEVWENFSIEFWLYPAALQNGETIFQAKGFKENNKQNDMVPQEISCRIENRRVQWKFSNFFWNNGEEENLFVLEGTPMIPRQWHHHLLRFNCESGLLEYLIDGIPADIIYTTKSGREEAGILLPELDKDSFLPLEIAGNFTGFMDELRIEKEFVTNINLNKYISQGTVITPVIDMEYIDSLITSIVPDENLPDNSRIYYFIKTTNQYLELENEAALEWEPLTLPLNNKSFIINKGRYAQLKFLLLPDVAKDISPSLNEIKISFKQKLPPPPPGKIMATTENSNIYLEWEKPPYADIRGYYIYIGEKPGEYLWKNSPVYAGDRNNFTIYDLEKYKQYFISIRSFDNAEKPQYSDFSQEISIRVE